MKYLLLLLLIPSVALAESMDEMYFDSWSGVSSAITDTTSTAIKTAITGRRLYVTSVSCSNTGAAATRIKVLCASTQVWEGMLAATTGSDGQSFTIPIRCGVSEALNAQPATTSSSTICSATGFSDLD